MKMNTELSLLCLLIAVVAGSNATANTITEFQAVLQNSNVTSDGAIASASSATGIATFVLTQPDGDPSGTTLSYHIQFDGLDLDGMQTAGVTADDVTAIHLHDITRMPDGSANPDNDTAGTLHVLNIFGVPRGGDDKDDMTFDAPAESVMGLWEDSDATPLQPMAPTLEISANVTQLLNEQLFVMVHSTEFSGGAIGGVIRVVPEPSAIMLAMIGGLGLLGISYRSLRR